MNFNKKLLLIPIALFFFFIAFSSFSNNLKKEIQNLFITSASASTITMGETTITPVNDSGNANLLIAQQTTLSQTATIQSLSFYVTTAAGNLRLGVYDATGPAGGPGQKKAETNEITPVTGWNTANVITPVSLPVGAYWLAYLPSSNSLGFRNNQTETAKFYSFTYGVMPQTFSTTVNTGTFHFSLYATLSTVSDTTAPVLSSGSPTGVLPAGTTQTTLSLTTDENATCKYGTTPNIAYGSIANTFTTTGGTSHSQTITGLTNGTSYNYHIRCSDALGNANTTDYTISFSVASPLSSDTTLPTTPTNLAATAVSSSQINLSWTASTDNVGITGYKIYRCVGSACVPTTQIATSNITSYSNTNLTASTAYTHTVSAYDGAGNESGRSITASAATLAAGSQTALAILAASMQPGEWAVLETIGFGNGQFFSPIEFGCNSGDSINQYADSATWDPIQRRFMFIGATHGNCYAGKFAVYQDNTNTWSAGPWVPGLCQWGTADNPCFNHAYDHNTVNPATGDFYHRYIGREIIYKYSALSDSWSELPPIPMHSRQVAGALEYFPEMDGLVFVDGDWGVWSYRVSANQWTHLANTSVANDFPGQQNLPMGSYSNFIEYNPIHKVLIFGGGGTSDLYKMEASGVITKMNNAPLALAIPGDRTGTLTTVDPISGKYLIFSADKRFYEYDVTTDTWTSLPTSSIPLFTFGDPVFDTIESPVSTYGVVMFVKYYAYQSKVYLYKHSPGTGTPLPTDTEAPSLPTNLAGVAVSSSQINLSWTASTDNIGVTGYQVYRDGALIATSTTTSYSVTGLSPATTYTFSVAAKDAAGNKSGSATTTGTTLSAPPHPPSEGDLGAAYSLDEVSGTIIQDASGNGNSGTLINGPVWDTHGKYQGALSFDGINDYVSIPNSLSLDIYGTNLTLSLWANIANTTRDYVILGKPWYSNTMTYPYYQYGIEFDGNGKKTADFYFGDPSGALHGPFSMPVPVDTWAHIAFTYDGAFVKGYMNGVEKLSILESASIQGMGNSLRIGVDGGFAQPFKGKVDNLRIYNRALSPAEIQTDMTTGIGGGTPPPTDTEAPSIPANLAGVAVSSSQINLSWTASTDNVGVTGYQVYRDGTQIATSTTTSYSVTGLAPATTYAFAVAAKDAAGNQSAKSISVNATTKESGPTGSDFLSRCNDPGVVRCVSFDSSADIAGDWGDNSGALSNPAYPLSIDNGIKASGDGSLKFTIPSQSGSDMGSYFTNFSPDLSTRFGENSEFYIQWRQRFSPELINTYYNNSGGFKQIIIGTGDTSICDPNHPTSKTCPTSCTPLEVVTQNTYQKGFAQMYNSCTGSASHGPWDPFYERFGNDFKLQNARPSPYCLYTQANSSYFPPTGNCFGYFPDEWMTFQIHIKTGPRVGNEFSNSHVDLWIAREGRPSEQALNWGPYNLTAGDPANNYEFGKLWLTPYQTGKDATQDHPTAYTWYDELIISRTRITDPNGTPPPPPPPDVTPPTISNLSASNIAQTTAAINWTTSEPSTHQVEYGFTSSYGSITSLNSNLMTSHSQTLSGLSAGTLYHYRVRSKDAVGNEAISTDRTFTTLAMPDTTPPSQITNLSSSNITETSVNLSWTSPGDDNNTGTASAYDIRYSTSPVTNTNWDTAIKLTGEPNPNASGTTQTYTAAGLSPNTTYYFAIKTQDEVPNISLLSNVVSVITKAPADIAPPAISNVQITNVTQTSANISFAADELSISSLEYGLTASYGSITPDSVLTKTHSFSLTNLLQNTDYHFRIKVKDAAQNIALSQDYRFTTAGLVLAVSNLSAINITSNSATIEFDTGRETAAVLNYGLSLTNLDKTVTDTNFLTKHSITISNLNRNTAYYYQATVRDRNNQTISSAVLSFKTSSRSSKPPKVSSLQIKRGSLFLTWENPTDYEFYKETIVLRLTNDKTDIKQNPSNYLNSKIFTTAGNSFEDKTVENDKTYYYWVFTKDDQGAYSDGETVSDMIPSSSAPSPTPTPGGGGGSGGGSGGGAGLASDTTPPTTPGSLKAIGTANQVILRWLNPKDSDFVRTKVIRKENSAPSSVSDGTVIYEGTGEEFTDTANLKPNTKYYYGVYSFDRNLNYSKPAVSSVSLNDFTVRQAETELAKDIKEKGKTSLRNSSGKYNQYNLGAITLKDGSRGEEVKELQRFLNDKLNLGLAIDGSLGPKTIEVIKKWQKDNNLTPDGLIGPKTKAIINAAVPAASGTIIPGCGNRNTGFSVLTGESCAPNTAPAIPANRKYNLGAVTLRAGSRGEEVKELQRFLNDKLNLGLAIDGSLGPKTISVIKQWQRDNNLTPDGLIGPKTRERMNGGGGGT